MYSELAFAIVYYIGLTHRRIFSLLRSFAPALYKEYSLVAILARASNCIQYVSPTILRWILLLNLLSFPSSRLKTCHAGVPEP